MVHSLCTTAIRLVGCLLLAQLASAAPVSNTVLSVDGSGTSNFFPTLLRVFEIIKARTKPAVDMTYRSIGTGLGQREFIADTTYQNSMFACGDYALSGEQLKTTSDQGNAAVNIPVLVGTVSVFANVPGVGQGDLKLDACTLSKIFKGEITSWDDPAIWANSVSSPDSKSAPIKVLYRAAASSSTYALTKYNYIASPQCWLPGDKAFSANFTALAASVITSPNFSSVPNSQEMVKTLLSTPWSIGYVESGQGVAAGLAEVALVNKDGNFHTSTESTVIPDIALPQDLANPGVEWNDNDYLYKPGPKQWPLTLISYFFLRTNLTAQGQAGGLTKYLVQFFLSKEVQDLLPAYGLVPLKEADRTRYSDQISTLIATGGQAWRTEGRVAGDTAQSDYVISELRGGHFIRTVTDLSNDLGTAREMIKTGGAYQVHAGGAYQAAPFMRNLMAELQGQARAPIHTSYRITGTYEAQQEFLNVNTAVANLNSFKVGDVPLTSDILTAMTNAGNPALQLPFAVGSMSVVFNQQVPGNNLRLDACLAARVFSGKIKSWNEAPFADQNTWGGSGSPSYLDHPITVFGYAAESSSTHVLTRWLSTCPDQWSTGGPAFNVTWNVQVTTEYLRKQIRTPQDMAAAVLGTIHSIGFLPSNVGTQQGLKEAYLKTKSNDYLRSRDANLQETIQQALPAEALNFQADWSQVVDLRSPQDPKAFPLTTLLYVYAYTDMKQFNNSGPITKALLNFMYSPSGQELLAESGLTQVPETLRLTAQADALKLIRLAPLLTEWAFETADAPSSAGMKLQSFSELRMSGEQSVIADLKTNMTALQRQVASGLTLHVAGAQQSGTGRLFRELLDELSDMATNPVRFVYEDVAEQDMPTLHSRLLAEDAAAPDLLVLDQPLSQDKWNELNAEVEVLQAPFAVRPLALIYSAGNTTNGNTTASLNLAPCTVAKIFKGKITSWNDADIAADNPNLKLPANTITLYGPCAAPGCGNLKALIDYCSASCSAEGLSYSNLAKINAAVPSSIADTVVVGGAYTVLALSTLEWLSGSGVQQVALRSSGTGKVFATPSQYIASDYTNMLLSKVGTDTTKYREAFVDWSDFSLAGAGPGGEKPDVYPLVRLDFLALTSDMSRQGQVAGALRGLVQYTLTQGQSVGVLADAAPAVAPMPAALAQQLWTDVSELTVLPGGVADWPVVSKSSDATQNVRPFVTSYVRSGGAGAATTASAPLTDSRVVDLAAQAARVAQAQVVQRQDAAVASTNDKANKANSIAVAALVLGLVLSLLSLALALMALRDARRALAALYTPALGASFTRKDDQGPVLQHTNSSNPALPPTYGAAKNGTPDCGLSGCLPSPSGRKEVPLMDPLQPSPYVQVDMTPINK